MNELNRPDVDSAAGSPLHVDRRAFLLAGVAGVALIATGCGPKTRSVSLPEVPWPTRLPPPTRPAQPERHTDIRTPSNPRTPSTNFPGVVNRSQWAKGNLVPTLANKLGGVRRITIHHDGMNPYFGTEKSSVANRIELIRRSHRGRGWADIGYHFVVDRSGRIWQARPLTYQGAHVKDHNENNIGVLTLGNFEQQDPSSAQLRALAAHVRALQSRFSVSIASVHTHQELAPTACPGRNLQPRIVAMRERRFAV